MKPKCSINTVVEIDKIGLPANRRKEDQLSLFCVFYIFTV